MFREDNEDNYEKYVNNLGIFIWKYKDIVAVARVKLLLGNNVVSMETWNWKTDKYNQQSPILSILILRPYCIFSHMLFLDI